MEEGVNTSPNGRPPPPGFNQAYLENNQPVGGAGNIASVGIVGQQPSAARADLWQQTLQVIIGVGGGGVENCWEIFKKISKKFHF